MLLCDARYSYGVFSGGGKVQDISMSPLGVWGIRKIGYSEWRLGCQKAGY